MENINIIKEVLKIYAQINNLIGFDCLVIAGIIVLVTVIKQAKKIKSFKVLMLIIIAFCIPTYFFEWFLIGCKWNESLRIAIVAPIGAMGFYSIIKGVWPKSRIAKWIVGTK